MHKYDLHFLLKTKVSSYYVQPRETMVAKF
jgi:hypothetical protein